MKEKKTRLFALVLFSLLMASTMASNVAAKKALLYDYATADAVLDSTKEFDYKAGASETDTGIYIESRTADDEYPVYYYRGMPQNNNVLYGGFCWLMLRTTSLGNIKLIYNGLPSDGKCTATGSDTNTIAEVAYAESNGDRIYGGYVYELDDELHDSVAKAALDEWYEENLIDLEDELADDVWCNSVNWEANHSRIAENGAPSNECSEEVAQLSVSTEVGNGRLKYPIAMITADELMFGGAGYNVENHNYYLTTGNKYHTITQQSAQKMFYQNSKYTLNRTGSLTYATGVRAVIALPNTTVINSGDGSKNNPLSVAVPKYTADSMTDSARIDGREDELFAEGELIRVVSDEGKIGSVTFYNEDGEEVDVDYTIGNDGSCSFVMPAYNVKFTIVIAQENPATFDGIEGFMAITAGLIMVSVICFANKRR